MWDGGTSHTRFNAQYKFYIIKKVRYSNMNTDRPWNRRENRPKYMIKVMSPVNAKKKDSLLNDIQKNVTLFGKK